jgi:hypothetical protein
MSLGKVVNLLIRGYELYRNVKHVKDTLYDPSKDELDLSNPEFRAMHDQHFGNPHHNELELKRLEIERLRGELAKANRQDDWSYEERKAEMREARAEAEEQRRETEQQNVERYRAEQDNWSYEEQMKDRQKQFMEREAALGGRKAVAAPAPVTANKPVDEIKTCDFCFQQLFGKENKCPCCGAAVNG